MEKQAQRGKKTEYFQLSEKRIKTHRFVFYDLNFKLTVKLSSVFVLEAKMKRIQDPD